MSAWYVFSALGFYPVCPGTTEYQIGSPLFDKATIHLTNGKTFVVDAKTNGPQRPYIQSATLNGVDFNKTFLEHSQITGGGELSLEMASAPVQTWATGAESRAKSAQRSVIRQADAKPKAR
jgi:putative alpha-1,2-mannosidase